MGCKYSIRADEVSDEDGTVYTTYGIDAVDCASGKVIQCIPDVFFSRRQAQELVDACNDLQLSPVHIMDVIEDAIAL